MRIGDAAVKSAQARLGSNVVPLGELLGGVCRHRALLFKVAADAVCDELLESGFGSPFVVRMVRGFFLHGSVKAPHVWNEVVLKGADSEQVFILDCMSLQKKLIPVPSAESARYLGPAGTACAPPFVLVPQVRESELKERKRVQVLGCRATLESAQYRGTKVRLFGCRLVLI